MMMRRFGRFAAALAMVACATGARAETLFVADLTNSQETGLVALTQDGGAVVRPASFGNASLSLNDANTALTLSVTIFEIDVTGVQTPWTTDNLIAAHIHAPALPGANGAIVWGFFGAPDNDIAPDQLVVTPLASGVGGVFTSTWDLAEGNSGTDLTSQLPNIVAGLAYLNFHTVQNPAGEIRGQILQVQVPEPRSIALLGLGIAGVAMARRRRSTTS